MSKPIDYTQETGAVHHGVVDGEPIAEAADCGAPPMSETVPEDVIEEAEIASFGAEACEPELADLIPDFSRYGHMMIKTDSSPPTIVSSKAAESPISDFQLKESAAPTTAAPIDTSAEEYEATTNTADASDASVDESAEPQGESIAKPVEVPSATPVATGDISHDSDKPLDTEEEIPEPNAFLFVGNHHSDASMRAGMRLMREEGVEVVALEAPLVESQARKQELSEMLTKAVASNATPEDIQRTCDITEGVSNPHILVEELQGTNTRIELIDIAEDSPAYNRMIEGLMAEKALVHATSLQAPNDALRSAAKTYLTLTAESNGELEEMMAGQSEKLGKKYPGAYVGIFAGGGHDSIKERLTARGHTQVSGRFVDFSGNVQELEHTGDTILANMRKDGRLEPAIEEVNRVVLEKSLLDGVVRVSPGPGILFSEEIVRELSDVQVAELLDVMDEIKATANPKLWTADTRDSIRSLAYMVVGEHMQSTLGSPDRS